MKNNYFINIKRQKKDSKVIGPSTWCIKKSFGYQVVCISLGYSVMSWSEYNSF